MKFLSRIISNVLFVFACNIDVVSSAYKINKDWMLLGKSLCKLRNILVLWFTLAGHHYSFLAKMMYIFIVLKDNCSNGVGYLNMTECYIRLLDHNIVCTLLHKIEFLSNVLPRSCAYKYCNILPSTVHSCVNKNVLFLKFENFID